MSMKIINYSQISYAEQLKEKSSLDRIEKEKEIEEEKKISVQKSDLHDEYIRSEKSEEKSSGLYRLGQDEKGNRRIFFDNPKKSSNTDGKEQSKVKPEDPEKPVEICTGNTDRVDREIKNLKEKRKQLEQQLRSASGDEQKTKELEKKLAQIESELSQKDTDAYRRQNTIFS